MNDSEFNALADEALKLIEAALEQSGADLDFAMISAGVLEIELPDGSKIIVACGRSNNVYRLVQLLHSCSRVNSGPHSGHTSLRSDSG